MCDTIRFDLRMDDDGDIFLDVKHLDPRRFDPGESCWLGHIASVSLVVPTLLSQLEALRGEWDEQREKRREEREEAERDHQSLYQEEWHGSGVR